MTVLSTGFKGPVSVTLLLVFFGFLSLSLLRALLQAIDISMGAAIFEQLTARLATTFWAAV